MILMTVVKDVKKKEIKMTQEMYTQEMEAVKNTGWALEFVKIQTPELCLAAVKKIGRLLPM